MWHLYMALKVKNKIEMASSYATHGYFYPYVRICSNMISSPILHCKNGIVNVTTIHSDAH